MMVKERLLPKLPKLLAYAVLTAICLGPAVSTAETECTCRYASQSFPVGACVCMDRPGGKQQLACCGVVLNNTSWEFSGESCPIADLGPAMAAETRTVSSGSFSGLAVTANLAGE